MHLYQSFSQFSVSTDPAIAVNTIVLSCRLIPASSSSRSVRMLSLMATVCLVASSSSTSAFFSTCIHLRAASMKPKSLQNSVSQRGTVVESFFCQLSSQLGSHFWSLSLSIGARKTIFKRLFGLVKSFGERFLRQGNLQQETVCTARNQGVKTIFRVVCNLPLACEQ